MRGGWEERVWVGDVWGDGWGLGGVCRKGRREGAQGGEDVGVGCSQRRFGGGVGAGDGSDFDCEEKVCGTRECDLCYKDVSIFQ